MQLNMIKLRLLAILLAGFSSSAIYAQNKGLLYLGIQPEITKEKEYGPSEFDINAVPFVVQYWVSDAAALRYTNTFNLNVGDGTQVSHLGGQLLIPWYFLHQKESDISGFYLAPLGGCTYNNISSSLEVSVGIEPGFTWFSDSGFTLFLGFQAGATWFSATNDTGGWRSHGGVKFSLGYSFMTGN